MNMTINSGEKLIPMTDANLRLTGRIGDVEKRHGKGCLNLRCHLMHGIGAEEDNIRPHLLQFFGFCGKECGTGRPIPLSLPLFNGRKVHTGH